MLQLFGAEEAGCVLAQGRFILLALKTSVWYLMLYLTLFKLSPTAKGIATEASSRTIFLASTAYSTVMQAKIICWRPEEDSIVHPCCTTTTWNRIIEPLTALYSAIGKARPPWHMEFSPQNLLRKPQSSYSTSEPQLSVERYTQLRG